jgi:Protein of unknown function (DUF3263)
MLQDVLESPTCGAYARSDVDIEHLDERSRAILDFERSRWREGGPKERAIRVRLGISASRYYRLLNRAIDLPQALRHDPLLVKRLRRLRVNRRRQRFEGSAGARR